MVLLLIEHGPSLLLIAFCKIFIINLIYFIYQRNFLFRSYNIVRLDVSHGGDLEDGRIRFHYPISFVVINENFVRHKDTGDDIALIKLSHELSIPFDQFPTINYYKIQDRTKASIFTGERKSILMGEQNSINIELRNHECIQSQDKSLRDIRKALCYEILTTKRALSKMFDGAPIISYDIRNNNFIRHLIAIHIENYELNSHFLYIGRGLNIAWHFHWIKIAKFNRDASHIPSNKKFYCCDVKTLNTFNTEPYEGRSFAPIAVQRTKMCYKQ